jgi:hypothetical protein
MERGTLFGVRSDCNSGRSHARDGSRTPSSSTTSWAGRPGRSGTSQSRGVEGADDAPVPNAFLDILALNDSAKLALTPDQSTKLQTAGDAFKIKSDSLIDKVANILGDTTEKAPDPMTIFAKLQPSMAEGRKLATQAINDAKAILTPEQWAKVPDSIKTPGVRREGGGGGRFDRGGPGN